MSEPEIIDLSSELSRKKILDSAPEYSVLGKITDLTVEPSLIVYGPTKTGKTRLISWEAATLATKLNRYVVFMLSEPNVEEEDIRDILFACMYHNVMCEVHRFDSPRSLNTFVSRLEGMMKRRGDVAGMPRVFVVDSVTAFANLVIDILPYNVVESGSPTSLPYIYPVVTKFFNRIRKMIASSNLSGYLLMTSHEMSLRGEKYNPSLPIKSKPRFTGVVQYMDDVEVYMSPCLEEVLCEEAKKYDGVRSLVTVTSRRAPETVGNSLAFVFMRMSEIEQTQPGKRKRKQEGGEKLIVEGLFSGSGDEYKYIPRDMLADESQSKKYKIDPLVPVQVCPLKNIRL